MHDKTYEESFENSYVMYNLTTFIKNTITASRAVMTGTCVGIERMEARLDICKDCELVNIYGDQVYCACGCAISQKESMLLNLARYEEVDGKLGYGCPHPDGSKWKERGV